MFIWEKKDPEAPTPRADFIRCWIIDLVDPFVKQTKETLMRVNGGACCLGRACVVAGLKKEKDGKIYNFITETNTYEDLLPDELQVF